MTNLKRPNTEMTMREGVRNLGLSLERAQHKNWQVNLHSLWDHSAHYIVNSMIQYLIDW